jgi:hypothetical protein
MKIRYFCVAFGTGRVPAFSKKGQQISLEEYGTTFADKGLNNHWSTAILVPEV